MNRYHRWYCGSPKWAAKVEHTLLPWALNGVELGDNILELGPGLGVTTRLLVDRVPELTAVEIDDRLATRLDGQLGTRVKVIRGDATDLPLADAAYSSVVCFTMLHHVPSADLQDRLFAEAHRVVRPGGVFAGSDSQPSTRFRLIHLFDTMTVVDPTTLPARLSSAGFVDVRVSTAGNAVRFNARRP